MSEMDKGILVEFKPAAKKPEADYPSTVKPRDYTGECRHAATIVDEQARTLSCRSCNVGLDPITVVVGWAKKWDHERWKLTEEKALDALVHDFHEAGGRVVIRPSGVVVEHEGKRWASSCVGGVTDQLRSALRRWKQDSRGWNLPKVEA